MNQQQTISAGERPCAACGYDLRASAGRCPECGAAISGLNSSRIPWEHRRTRGRLRAYFATVAIVVLRPWQLARESGRVVRRRDGVRFHHVSLVVATVIVGVLAAVGLAVCWENWTAVTHRGDLPMRRLHVRAMEALLDEPWVIAAAMVACYASMRVSMRCHRAMVGMFAGSERVRRRIGRLGFYLSGMMPVQAVIWSGVLMLALWLRLEEPWVSGVLEPPARLVCMGLMLLAVVSFVTSSLAVVLGTGERRWLRAAGMVVLYPVVHVAAWTSVTFVAFSVAAYATIAIGSMLYRAAQ